MGSGLFTWVGEYTDPIHSPTPPPPSGSSSCPTKQEFSKPLLEFLKSIGVDTSKLQLIEYDIVSIITKYAAQNNLSHPTNKRRIVCNERLNCLFRRKSISLNQIHGLLEQHYLQNQQPDSSSSDYKSNSNSSDSDSQEEDRDCKGKRKRNAFEVAIPKRMGRFVAIVPDNMKLVYLKKSLVENLLLKHEKDPYVFEKKVVGSFVRIKSGREDYLQKNTHQLLRVAALVNKPSRSDGSDISLQLSGTAKDVSIGMLSDDKFSEEECEELCQRMEGGLVNRPTVVELQHKVHLLHEDITKHWITTELALLQTQIDLFNEKGWRCRLFECLERREFLENKDEQERLLLQVPELTAANDEDMKVQVDEARDSSLTKKTAST